MSTNNTQLSSAIFKTQKHPFHILPVSALPVATASFLFVWLVPQVFYMHGIALNTVPRADLMHLGFLGLFVSVMNWFISILREAKLGYHTQKVQLGLRLGMLLFIASEVMFFFAFFWSFFHFTLIPATAIGAVWPPVGAQPLDVWGLPFVNTALLLTSGVMVTGAHHCLQSRKRWARAFFFDYLMYTILLGMVFLFCQAYEYTFGVKFSWRENIYGSIFFITTGFHGLHVTIGTLFLIFCLARAFWTMGELEDILPGSGTIVGAVARLTGGAAGLTQNFGGFRKNHHFGFEAAAWYWHFVDVVWVFLFISVYWWGGF